MVIRISFVVKGTGAAPPLVEDGDRAVIYEDGEPVAEVALGKPRPKDLTVMLALDHSGSMKRPSKSGVTKMKEAQDAARNFIDRLHDKADAGLVLFDDKVELALPPARNAARLRDHRKLLLARIDSATPSGGTAYLDAVYQSLETLKDNAGKGAVVLMTDGVDLDSQNTEAAVIARAKELKIPVYVIGVGDAGWTKPVSTVLVLDHSKSMERPTGADKKSKIEALHDAGERFTKLMRAGARVTVLPFSSRVERPEEFTEDKEAIKARIKRLRPAGGTSLYDATLAGIETLVAANNPGKKYVVAMTDGVDEDPGSRHDPEEVIARAKAAGVQLYMLGLGALSEINDKVMRQDGHGHRRGVLSCGEPEAADGILREAIGKDPRRRHQRGGPEAVGHVHRRPVLRRQRRLQTEADLRGGGRRSPRRSDGYLCQPQPGLRRQSQ